jgi:hypothetical protein
MDFALPCVWGGVFLAGPVPGEKFGDVSAVFLLLRVCSIDGVLEGLDEAEGIDGMEGDPKWARWAASMVLLRESVVNCVSGLWVNRDHATLTCGSCARFTG